MIKYMDIIYYNSILNIYVLFDWKWDKVERLQCCEMGQVLFGNIWEVEFLSGLWNEPDLLNPI
jgi:hypothetical protein